MQIPIIPPRGQKRPWSSLPRINWNHPLARGLAYYGYDTGTAIVDLVSNTTLTFTTGTLPGTKATPFGLARAWTSGGAGTTSSNLAYAFAGANYSIACAWFITALPSVAFTAPFGFQSTAGNSDATFLWNAAANTDVQFSVNNVNPTPVSGFNSINVFHTLVGVGVTTTSQILYGDGKQIATTALTDNGTPNHYPVNFNGLAGSGTTPQENGVAGAIFYGALWGRQLTAVEAFQLHTDPYCFLIYPEDELFAELVGASAAPSLIAPILAGRINIGIGPVRLGPDFSRVNAGVSPSAAFTMGATLLAFKQTTGRGPLNFRNNLLNPVATTEITGSLNVTEADDTLSATSLNLVQPQLFIRTAFHDIGPNDFRNNLLNPIQTAEITGSFNVTEDNDTLSATSLNLVSPLLAVRNTAISGPTSFRDNLLNAIESSEAAGSLNVTEDDDALSATGTVPASVILVGTLLSNRSTAGLGPLNVRGNLLNSIESTEITGSLNVTEADDTLLAGSLSLVSPLLYYRAVDGQGPLNFRGNLLNATQSAEITGTFNATEDNDALSATSINLVSPLLFARNTSELGPANFRDNLLNATLSSEITGSLNVTEADDTLAGTSITLVQPLLFYRSLSGLGPSTFRGNVLNAVLGGGAVLNLTEADDTLSATGAVQVTGTASITEGDDGLLATGTASQPAPPPQTGGGGGGGGGEWVYEEPRRPEPKKKKKKKKDEPAPTPEVVMGPTPQIRARVVAAPEPLPIPPGLADLDGDRIAKLVLEQQQRKTEAEAKAQRDYDDALAVLLLTS